MRRSGNGGSGRVKPLASLVEISRVLEETARIICEHARSAGEGDFASVSAVHAQLNPAENPNHIRTILNLRAVRRDFLGFEASDATLSVLLALYAARLEGRRLHQTALALAARVPQTTVLRITREHLERGTLECGPDAEDKRLLLISLAEPAAARLRAYLATAAGIGPPLV